MGRGSNGQAQVRRAAALVVATTVAVGCASLHTGSQRSAVETALQNVCGSTHAPADSSCTVRAVTREAHGYRVVVDRRPPAGNDRVAVLVRPAGLLGGSSVEVTPLDTAGMPPVR
ncbi:MAG TPA: hypothetical protein VIQ60_14485 [Gemmatimonadaceae bacterium]